MVKWSPSPRAHRAGLLTQPMPWDPMKDYAFMWANTQKFMSIFRCSKPVICKVHGYAVAGGSDIALCADMVVMASAPWNPPARRSSSNAYLASPAACFMAPSLTTGCDEN